VTFKSLTLFRDYKEDHRVSMDIYADDLKKALTPKECIVNDYTPIMPSWLKKLRIPFSLKIRYARYIIYPYFAKRNQSSINHIIDQSYAHLLNTLEPSRTIITVHDIIPIIAWEGKIPGLVYPHYPLIFKLTIASLKKARAIVTVSDNTKNDLIKYCNLDGKDIYVIPNGVNPCFKSYKYQKRKDLKADFNFPLNTHIVLITGNQFYKNHITSFRVISNLEKMTLKPIQLVWLGSDNEVYNKCTNTIPLLNKVICYNDISQAELVNLYNSVDCLLFPSLYEGFGWPPLEAMACGTPAITSNISPLSEVVGDAALTNSPSDISGLVKSTLTILENEHTRFKYIELGLEHVKNYSWDVTASRVYNLYEKIIND
jgi:glycosyltransferase involved in cell wall biosynthesis